MVQRLTYRKRHSYATKSNQNRVVKTPGMVPILSMFLTYLCFFYKTLMHFWLVRNVKIHVEFLFPSSLQSWNITNKYLISVIEVISCLDELLRSKSKINEIQTFNCSSHLFFGHQTEVVTFTDAGNVDCILSVLVPYGDLL